MGYAQDVRHDSQVDPTRVDADRRSLQQNLTHRAQLHRWTPLDRFCDPATLDPIEP